MRSYKITANLMNKNNIADKTFQQYDYGNKIEFELLEGAQKIDLTGKTILTYWLKNGSTVPIEKSATVNSNGNIEVKTTQELLEASGELLMQILVSSNDEQARSQVFKFNVEKSLNGDNAIIEDPNYSSDLVTELIQLRDSVRAETIDKINSVENNLNEISTPFQERLAPEVNYTGAFQRTIDLCPEYGTIILPSSFNLNIDEVYINKPINIKGGTILSGSIIIDVEKYETNMSIDNVCFKGENPLIIKQLRGANIKNCRFYNNKKSIWLRPYCSDQGIARIKIFDNIFYNNDYDLYSDAMENNKLAVADLHFQNNMCKWSNITHIDLETCDGLVLTDNTFFCPSIDTKMHHLNIRQWSNWTIIEGNNFFEAGAESINLMNPQNFNISGNNFAWNGQYHRANHIKIKATLDNCFNAIGIIESNNFNISSMGGVELIDVDYITVTDNNIVIEPASSKWKGTEELDASKLYGVYINNTKSYTLHINVDNICNRPDINCNVTDTNLMKFQTNKQYYTLSNTAETIINGNYDYIIIGCECTIEKITPSGKGHELTIITGGNGKATIKNKNDLILQSNRDFLMRPRTVIKFVYLNNMWQLVSVEGMTKNKTRTINDNSSTISIYNDEDLIAINNTQDTTITAITEGYNGKEITLLCYDGYTTLENNSTISLKSQTNLKLTGVNNRIKLVWYADRWWEV